MKKILVILGIALFTSLVEASPAYTNGQWYIWSADQVQVAAAALNYINVTSGFFPIYETRRGVLNTNKISTLRWTDAVVELKDGRVGFPRIPDSLLDTIGVPADQRELFWTTFSPTAVVVTSDMIKEEEE